MVRLVRTPARTGRRRHRLGGLRTGFPGIGSLAERPGRYQRTRMHRPRTINHACHAGSSRFDHGWMDGTTRSRAESRRRSRLSIAHTGRPPRSRHLHFNCVGRPVKQKKAEWLAPWPPQPHHEAKLPCSGLASVARASTTPTPMEESGRTICRYVYLFDGLPYRTRSSIFSNANGGAGTEGGTEVC